MDIEAIMKICPGRVLRDEPMSAHTSFSVGGPADFYVTPKDAQELAQLVAFLYCAGTDYLIIGNGSNLLISDTGLRAVVIDLAGGGDTEFTRLSWHDNSEGFTVSAGSGVSLRDIGELAAGIGAAGFEALSGIPGSVGGGLIMNAGAYGLEMKDVVSYVRAIDREGHPISLRRDEIDFRYRGSSLRDEGIIVLSADFTLTKGDPAEVTAKTEDYKEQRKAKQPLEYPSAGSTFKRPEGYFAGRLISEAGLRGRMIGGAQVSEKHAGFIINRDHASAGDIYSLICLVRDEVRKQSGVTLTPEVIMLGDFGEEA